MRPEKCFQLAYVSDVLQVHLPRHLFQPTRRVGSCSRRFLLAMTSFVTFSSYSRIIVIQHGLQTLTSSRTRDNASLIYTRRRLNFSINPHFLSRSAVSL